MSLTYQLAFPNRHRYVYSSLTDLVRAIVLIVRLANLALKASPDLSSDTYPITNLDCRHLVSNLDGFANDLVTDAKRQISCTPAACDCVYIRTTDTACVLTKSDTCQVEVERVNLQS